MIEDKTCSEGNVSVKQGLHALASRAHASRTYENDDDDDDDYDDVYEER
jgi:hypothetical protein